MVFHYRYILSVKLNLNFTETWWHFTNTRINGYPNKYFPSPSTPHMPSRRDNASFGIIPRAVEWQSHGFPRWFRTGFGVSLAGINCIFETFFLVKLVFFLLFHGSIASSTIKRLSPSMICETQPSLKPTQKRMRGILGITSPSQPRHSDYFPRGPPRLQCAVCHLQRIAGKTKQKKRRQGIRSKADGGDSSVFSPARQTGWKLH